MEVNCTTCKGQIKAESINVAKDTAYCTQCENLLPLSSLLPDDNISAKAFDPHEKVDGLTAQDKLYMWSIDVSHRNKMAFFLIPFTCLWAGGSMFSIYGQQYLSGEFNLTASLFGLPFLLGSLFLISLCFMSLFGRTYISCENDKALYFVGVGAIGKYKRFRWSSIKKIKNSSSLYYNDDEEMDGFHRQHGTNYRRRFFRRKRVTRVSRITLVGDEEFTIGKGLNAKQRAYILGFLAKKIS